MNTPNRFGLLFNTKVCGVNLLFFTYGKLEHIEDLRLAKYLFTELFYMEHHKNYEASYNSLSSIVLSSIKLKIGETNLALARTLIVTVNGVLSI